jgi:fumarylpyruvate hydrolase
MTDFVFPAPPQASVAVAGRTARFAVRRIICVGRNYADHAAEMGAPAEEPPMFFTKPADAVVDSGAVLPFPSLTSNLHHEVELVVALGAGGSDIPESQAAARIWGHGVGIDLTRRDLQAAAKAKGHPWDWAKGFDSSAPCGPLLPHSDGAPAPDAAITLAVNGVLRQSAHLSDMIWSVPAIIAQASRAIALAPGDLIYTGTPAGVGPLVRGDRVEARVDGLPELVISLAA